MAGQGFLLFRFVIFAFITIGVKAEQNLTFQLNNGNLMPLVGYGTSRITGTENVRDTLDLVLGAGYRLIDTAKVYRNEEDIGKALKELLPKHNLTRKDIWITSKLPSSELGDNAYEILRESLQKLNTDYIDLYLIHFPGYSYNDSRSLNNSRLRDESWQQLVRGLKDGLARNIGVSNYAVRHLKELLANDHGVKPAVNQVEWHPYHHDEDLLALCRNESILLQAFFSLGGTGNLELISHPKVQEIAKKLGKTPAQVLLRWAVQQNIAVIPKSRSKIHMDENYSLDFNIPQENMDTLSSFEQKRYGRDQASTP